MLCLSLNNFVQQLECKFEGNEALIATGFTVFVERLGNNTFGTRCQRSRQVHFWHFRGVLKDCCFLWACLRERPLAAIFAHFSSESCSNAVPLPIDYFFRCEYFLPALGSHPLISIDAASARSLREQWSPDV